MVIIMTLDLFSNLSEEEIKGDEIPVYYNYHLFTQGNFLMASTADGLCAIGFPNTNPDIFFKNLKIRFPKGQLIKKEEPFREVINQLEEYFSGSRQVFDLPLELAGTPFQLSVWKYLLTIPYGEIQSYKQVATALNTNPRTVGRAIGDNPVPIIVPCHRVIGSNGQMVGFRGGINMKIWLLQHENAIIL